MPPRRFHLTNKMKVSFRKVRESDLSRLNDIVNDSRVSRYLSLIPPVSLKSTREFYMRQKASGNLWECICLDGDVAGAVLLMLNPKGLKKSHVASVGIDIDKPYWGMGVGTKALKYIIKKARSKGIKRLEIEYIDGNRRAERLYLKMGFVKEGLRKRAYRVCGKYHDSITMYMWLK
jgi:RimJ/RimL family protein N-acetyltransferase